MWGHSRTVSRSLAAVQCSEVTWFKDIQQAGRKDLAVQTQARLLEWAKTWARVHPWEIADKAEHHLCTTLLQKLYCWNQGAFTRKGDKLGRTLLSSFVNVAWKTDYYPPVWRTSQPSTFQRNSGYWRKVTNSRPFGRITVETTLLLMNKCFRWKYWERKGL